MQIPMLSYVNNKQQIQVSLDTFNSHYQQARDVARRIASHTTYWVYSPKSKTFGPSRFVGFQNMNFHNYETARKGPSSGDRFDGHETRKAIEKALQDSYAENSELARDLIRWGQSLLGSDVFERVDEAKWKFISL